MKLKAIGIMAICCAALGAGYYLYTHGAFVPKATVEDSALGVAELRQLVTEDNQRSRTIMFAAASKEDYALEYRERGAHSTRTLPAQDASFKDGKSSYVLYKAKLTGLEPATDYEYRIVNGKNQGSWHVLATDNGRQVKAMIFSDSQSGDGYATWRKLAHSAWEHSKAAQLYLNLGDQVDNGASKEHWQGWFSGIVPFAAELPAATVVGNHETYDLKWKPRLPKAYHHLFALPEALASYKNQFYSFDYGPIHFTVLDTNYTTGLQLLQPGLGEEQLAWLENDLMVAKAPWKVVLMHRDVLMYKFSKASGRSSKRETKFNSVAKDLMPIFDKYGVDVVLSGHLHAYRRRVRLKNFVPHAQGTTYILTGPCGDQIHYAKLWEDFVWDAQRSPERPDIGNYMTLDAEPNFLTLQAFLPDGREFDKITLKKNQTDGKIW